MPSRNLHKGALITREAYVALRELKSLIEVAVEKTHAAEFEAAGMAVSSNPKGNPLQTLKAAAVALQSTGFDHALAEARNKVDTAVAWHESQKGMIL